MILMVVVLGALGSLASTPAYLWSRRNGRETWWLVVAWAPALALWFGLSVLGIGAQSLSNFVEVFVVFGAGIVLTYAKVFLVDRWARRPTLSTAILVVVLAVGAAGLRLLMPSLPE